MAKKKKNSKGNGQKPMSDKRFLTEKARSLPIYGCYVNEGWQESGMAHVIVARERGNGNLCVGMFLCDTWCLGVKNAEGAMNLPKEELRQKMLYSGVDYVECDYNLAHNIVYGAEAFAADADIPPTPAFKLWSNILEEDTEDVPLIELEFGHEGKYHLMAREGSKEARLIPALKKQLGENFNYTVEMRGESFDEDYYEDDSADDDDPEASQKLWQNVMDGLKKTQEEDRRHPEEVYSYNRPDYPTELNLTHPFIAEEFRKPSNYNSLPVHTIDRILALPKEEAVKDICNLLLYTIGKTWKPIEEDDTQDWEDDATLLHSVAMLTQLNDPAALDSVLEILRQTNDFIEFHFSDAVDMIIPQALYRLGRNNPEKLEEFLRHPGFDGFAKSYVALAISFIATEEPERREEIIELFRRYLNFMQENIPTQNGCSGYVAAAIISTLINLKATELLPEIKKLFDSDYVNLNVCGTYKDVKRDIHYGHQYAEKYDFTDIFDFYTRFQRAFGN